MLILHQDWIKDTDWIEYHLTNRGWARGSIRRERGIFEQPVDVVQGRLMTIRSLETIPSDPKKPVVGKSEIRWITDRIVELERAQDDWGVLPPGAYPLLRDQKERFRDLKHVRLMLLGQKERPWGKKTRGW